MVLLAEPELIALLEQFYILTGMRIVVRDERIAKVAAYPIKPTHFCGYMRGDEAFDAKCNEHERRTLGRCRREKRLIFFHCHAGLTGAISPIIVDDTVMGYLMLAQVSDRPVDDQFVNEVRAYCQPYKRPENFEECVRKIKYKKQSQIVAAARIMEAITAYILQKELLRPQKKQLFDRVDLYIEEHLDEDISVTRLCEIFHVSRTHLYSILAGHPAGGIAGYIREKRLSVARKMLKNTNIPIADISLQVGFSDYNYFLRVFKKHYGISPKALRRSVEK